MRLSGATLSVNLAPNYALRKIFYYPVANINFSSNAVSTNQPMSLRKDSLFSLARNSVFGECYMSKCSSGLFEMLVSSTEIENDGCPRNLETENEKERQRRRKIGLANKGKVPWNKGKKHHLETRKRIKQKTIEALSDPMVRKKMSEYTRTHSDQVKVKISSSLRRVWGMKLMKKRLNEAFFFSWMKSIAVAAKKGGEKEQELDWDSYDKIKQEMLDQKLQLEADNAKTRKVHGRVRKSEKGDDSAEAKKTRIYSRRRNVGKRKMKEGEDIQREMKELTATERSRLKQRLKKIRKKITINGAVTTAQGSISSAIRQNTSWKKLDLDLVKKGEMRKEVSLADQIQVAKIRKAESIACKVLVAESTLSYRCTGEQNLNDLH